MSLGREIDHWGTNPGDAIDAALTAIEAALHDLLSSDPAYWRTGQKKDVLERLEKLQAQQAALKLRVHAAAGDIAEETGDKDASAWMRADLLVDKGAARSQIKLASSVAKYERVAAGLADGVVSLDKARVVTTALDRSPPPQTLVTRRQHGLGEHGLVVSQRSSPHPRPELHL